MVMAGYLLCFVLFHQSKSKKSSINISVMFWPDQHHAQLFSWRNIITIREYCWKIGHINVEVMSHIPEMVRDSHGK
jgi:hypothetical protein